MQTQLIMFFSTTTVAINLKGAHAGASPAAYSAMSCVCGDAPPFYSKTNLYANTTGHRSTTAATQ